jgi:hypothetical protein
MGEARKCLLHFHVKPKLVFGRGIFCPQRAGNVAQSCTLPYRRFLIGNAFKGREAATFSRGAEFNSAIRQIENLRYN